MIRNILIFVHCFITTYLVFGQNIISENNLIHQSVVFKAHPNQQYGFDAIEHIEWCKKYPQLIGKNQNQIYTSFKTIKKEHKDYTLLVSRDPKKCKIKDIKLFILDKELIPEKYNDSTLQIELPSKNKDYIVKAYINNQIVAKLYVQVQKEIREKITIIPLVTFALKEKDIKDQLNLIYKQANIQFDVHITDVFKSKVFESSTILSNPDSTHNQYTGQMRLLRDLYLEQHPKMDKNTYLIFVLNGFEDSLLNGYMAKNKSIAFTKNSTDLSLFTSNLAKTLAFGVGGLDNSWLNDGPARGSCFNLMDTLSATHLTHFQWNNLRKTPNYYSIYDNEEHVQTNNGTVAYYFWEEDKYGNIIFKNQKLLNAIKRPYKHNFLSYHFKVKYFVLRPFYKIGDYYISILDVLFLLVTLLILLFIRKKIKTYWEKKKWNYKFIRKLLFTTIIGATLFLIYDNYWITNRILYYFKQVSGPIRELDTLNYKKAKRELLFNDKLLHQEVPAVCSEILIQKDNAWFIKKRSKVLYLEMKKDKKGKWNKAKFVSSSNYLHLTTLHFNKKSEGHYIVINYLSIDGNIEKQKVFDYTGLDITSKIKSENKAKRILVFVNGYRPTSIGQTFEENFSDIQNKGLEFPNSKNFIYDFDRFDYWQPWNKINLLIQKRINPNETYYADGHFSVTTSNYRSLINFSSTSTSYPKRCSNPKKHHCYTLQNATLTQFIIDNSKTMNLLKMHPNKKGFYYRKFKGKIAGKNLLQIINEIPGYSKNDTLYIVAHSMGFAYSQGMIEELRGKINFGGYYIIAPENGKTGYVNPSEWQEIWQYGSNFNSKWRDAPCLQDGIAPQYKVQGLPDQNCVYIPKKLYYLKGFYNSHFIGNYTWVLKIEENKPGCIRKK